ncbi:heavy-metal-associated domain-containing protein [Megalodesulfovibrio gigas]|uniref:heavy-metal-associated domain-containing protein n=1 Tax=Megalodesulfovibrio gigas TaxID=879 RepID=UPI000428DDCD|nr:heavy metal-associated domain-containing protein [Megalodesulfovibrio gigas]
METIKVVGMSCMHCVKSVTDTLSKLDGVQQVQVNLETGTATFENTKGLPAEQIKLAIKMIGFEVA